MLQRGIHALSREEKTESVDDGFRLTVWNGSGDELPARTVGGLRSLPLLLPAEVDVEQPKALERNEDKSWPPNLSLLTSHVEVVPRLKSGKWYLLLSSSSSLSRFLSLPAAANSSESSMTICAKRLSTGDDEDGVDESGVLNMAPSWFFCSIFW